MSLNLRDRPRRIGDLAGHRDIALIVNWPTGVKERKGMRHRAHYRRQTTDGSQRTFHPLDDTRQLVALNFATIAVMSSCCS